MFFYVTLLSITMSLIIFAGIYDFFRLRIPNYIPVILIGTFFLTYTTTLITDINSFQSIQSHLLAGMITFIIMFTLFCLKLFGGGDAKLIPVIALWVGVEGVFFFLLWTALFGFPLAITALFLKNTKTGNNFANKISSHKIFNKGWIKALANGRNVVPYGIAIAAGAIITFIELDYLP